MNAPQRHLSAQVVAQLLGIKTSTLAKWRREGKGPTEFFHLSKTLVVYEADAVAQFLDERKRAASGG
jgi:predicted site-specific integrase-resolvase